MKKNRARRQTLRKTPTGREKGVLTVVHGGCDKTVPDVTSRLRVFVGDNLHAPYEVYTMEWSAGNAF